MEHISTTLNAAAVIELEEFCCFKHYGCVHFDPDNSIRDTSCPISVPLATMQGTMRPFYQLWMILHVHVCITLQYMACYVKLFLSEQYSSGGVN